MEIKIKGNESLEELEAIIALLVTIRDEQRKRAVYNPNTKSFDIDRFSSKVSSSQRNKVILLKQTLIKLKETNNLPISVEDLKNLTDFTDQEFEEAIRKLGEAKDIFKSKEEFIDLL